MRYKIRLYLAEAVHTITLIEILNYYEMTIGRDGGGGGY